MQQLLLWKSLMAAFLVDVDKAYEVYMSEAEVKRNEILLDEMVVDEVFTHDAHV